LRRSRRGQVHSDSERRWNNFKGLKEFYSNAKARIWLLISRIWLLISTSGTPHPASYGEGGTSSFPPGASRIVGTCTYVVRISAARCTPIHHPKRRDSCERFSFRTSTWPAPASRESGARRVGHLTRRSLWSLWSGWGVPVVGLGSQSLGPGWGFSSARLKASCCWKLIGCGQVRPGHLPRREETEIEGCLDSNVDPQPQTPNPEP